MRTPQVAFLDIETAPIKAYVWGLFEENAVGVVRDTYLLSFAYKWQGKSKIHTRALPDYLGYRHDKENDRQLVTDLHSVFDEADIIVAHNGVRFDTPKSMSRFVVHGLPPPSPFKQIDTLQIARRTFKFDSNSLDNLARYLGVGRKMKHQRFALWEGCMAGDLKSWKVMRGYNKQDVALLERIYDKLRAWSPSHPRFDAYSERYECPVCQSKQIQQRGFRVARTRKTQRLHCQSCGHWFGGAIVKKAA